MAPRLEVVKGVSSQRVHFYPQEGRPSSTPTVEIKDESGNTHRAAADTYVTQGTANTTVSSASSVGDESLTLTAVTGITVRREAYLVTNSNGNKEWVRVTAVDSTNKVAYVDEPLEYAHDTSATFQDCSFYYTLQTTDVDTLEQMWRARASYTVDSLTYTQEVPFDVVLTPLVNPLTVGFIKKWRPNVTGQEFAATRGTDFDDLREAAWDKIKYAIRRHCTGRALGENWRPALLRTPDDVEEWALAEFDLLSQRNGIAILAGVDPERALEMLGEERDGLRHASLSSLHFLDIDEDDARDDDEAAPSRPDFVR